MPYRTTSHCFTRTLSVMELIIIEEITRNEDNVCMTDDRRYVNQKHTVHSSQPSSWPTKREKATNNYGIKKP